MKYRHNLQLVRMFYADQTWHCAVHGRLSDEEAAEVIHRMGASLSEIYAADQLIQRNPLVRAWAAVNHWWAMLAQPKCEPLA